MSFPKYYTRLQLHQMMHCITNIVTYLLLSYQKLTYTIIFPSVIKYVNLVMIV